MQSLSPSNPESGNVVFFVLLAVVLIGLVTAAIRSGGEGQNIDRETMVIQASQARQYASELERGIAFIMQDSASETEIRFASTTTDVYGDISATPTRQIFAELGGGVTWRAPPDDISSAGHWEFYGNTHLPDVGTARPDLIAVLPNVTAEFCNYINEVNSQSLTAPGPPAENGDCNINDTAQRFVTGNLFQDGAPNTVDDTSFTAKPAMEACIQCAGPVYHYYHVLLAR